MAAGLQIRIPEERVSEDVQVDEEGGSPADYRNTWRAGCTPPPLPSDEPPRYDGSPAYGEIPLYGGRIFKSCSSPCSDPLESWEERNSRVRYPLMSWRKAVNARVEADRAVKEAVRLEKEAESLMSKAASLRVKADLVREQSTTVTGLRALAKDRQVGRKRRILAAYNSNGKPASKSGRV